MEIPCLPPAPHGHPKLRRVNPRVPLSPAVSTPTSTPLTCGGFIISAQQIWPDRLGHRLIDASLMICSVTDSGNPVTSM